MSPRMSGDDRRAQIVLATLELLADRPVHAISTRAIAERVGVSQPALFRHFGSRDEILIAAIHESRELLASRAAKLMNNGPADELVWALMNGILDHAEANPWLPRLFLHTLSDISDPLRAALNQLPSMNRALVADLVRQGQREGAFSPKASPEKAAAIFVGLLQGLLLQALNSPEVPPLRELWPPIVEAWLAMVAGGEPASDTPDVQIPEGPPLATLDVRPILAGGADPLPQILAALSQTPADGLVLLTAPFRPAPLLDLLTGRGFSVAASQETGGLWDVAIGGPALTKYSDHRHREAPEPLQKILEALHRLLPGESLAARTPRRAGLLLDRIPDGWECELLEVSDGSGLVHIRRDP